MPKYLVLLLCIAAGALANGPAAGQNVPTAGQYVPSSGGDAAAPDAGSRTHIYANRDFFGNDLAAPRVATSQDACAAQCVGESRCVAFGFVAASGLCYLKNAIDTPREATGTTAGVLTSRVADPIAQGTAPNAVAPSGDLDANTSSCNVADSPSCPGCSVTCPQGSRAACTRGAEAVNTGCSRAAYCRCASGP